MSRSADATTPLRSSLQASTVRLLAISDLHLGHHRNRDHLHTIGAAPDDWLILAGDVGETTAHLRHAFDFLCPRFRQLIWVPGNHELWTSSRRPGAASGEARYQALVELVRGYGVITPEDPYPRWPGDGRTYIAPLFTLYDYSFRPDDLPIEQVVTWAAEEKSVCADEYLLDPAPYESRAAWCSARVRLTEARLAALPPDSATVLISHFPLRRRHAHLPRVPRFAPWCGTRLTEAWPERFRAHAVVYGHLHIRRSFQEEQVQFHEVSLGYPRQWDQQRTIASYLRVILEG